ncbi:MAG: glutathione S-transferase family protein, partial [Leucothrix sp.]
EAIAEYLNEKYPQHPLLPDALKLRAKVRELSRFHDTRLEPALRKLFAYIAPDARDMTVITQQAQQLNSRLAELAQLLSSIAQDGDTGYTFQTLLTLGDCGFAISFLWIEQLSQTMGFAIVWPPIVIDYKAHIQTLDAVAEELADYQPKLTQWLATTTLS